VSQIHDLVAPKLGANGIRHAEAVDVENAAAQAELGDVFDHADALEPDRLQVVDERGGSVRIALAELEPQIT
jgi:hypothetical protein